MTRRSPLVRERARLAAKQRRARLGVATLLCLGVVSCDRPPPVPHHIDAGTVAADPPRPAPDPGLLRVCSDPNNLPFSNDRGEGFENALAMLVAGALGKRVDYTWWPQRRGFIRSTLAAGLCDVVMGVPADFEAALTTRPYYRSTYVFVSRKDRALGLTSLEDARLRTLKIGLHVVGDDVAGVPPASVLAARGIIANVRGYSIYGSYDRPNPPADLVTAVSNGEVDVAIAWGPLAGFFAAPARSTVALDVTRIEPVAGVPLQFSISMAVRHGDRALRDRLDDVLQQHALEIDDLLARFSVPRVSKP